MSKFTLNLKSGFLHKEDHGGDSENAKGFDRADEADLLAHREGTKLQFCKVCFPDSTASNQAEQAPVAAEKTSIPPIRPRARRL